jgi:EmrB/QacA subfamily drug resistance transporter
MASTAAATKSSRLDGRLWAILLVVLLADVLDLMDSTITNIAAPVVERELGGGESLIKWLGSSYALAMGVFLVVGGRLGDRYGWRRMFLIGLSGFVLASAWCGLSTDPAMLIAARLVQGASGALLIPQGIGILITTFRKEQLPTAFAAFGPILGASAILGPILAGFIVSADIAGLTWRPVFLINIALGGLSLVAAAKVLPADSQTSDTPIDGIGAGILAVAMFGLIYGLIEGSTNGWSAVPVASLAVGVLALLAFGYRQATADGPLVAPSLLRNRGFTAGLLVGLAYFAAVNGLAYVIALYFQLGLGLTPRHTALSLAPLMIGIIIASFAGRPILQRLGRTLTVIGLCITAVGLLFMWAVARHHTGTSVLAFALPLLVLGVGMGFCFASIYEVAIGDVAHEEAGGASGSLSAVQQLANALGSAIVTTVYFNHSATGASHAVALSLLVVGGIVLCCLGLVWLMPAAAPAEDAEVTAAPRG